MRPWPATPGEFDGNVESSADFAKCSPPRRSAILNALSVLMQRYQEGLLKAGERLEAAARAVEVERTRIGEEREFLATIMATYIEYSHVIALDAAHAIESASGAEAGTGETACGLDAEHDGPVRDSADATPEQPTPETPDV